MGVSPKAPELDQYAFDFIAHRARDLVGQYGFTQDDEDDIAQDLLADLLQRRSQYDPARASFHTFVNRVVTHGVARLIERQKASCRDYRQAVCSLNDPVEGVDGEPAERGDLLDQDAYLASIGQSPLSLADQVSAQVDLSHLRATLPPELRVFLERLGEGHGLTDISAQTGLRRGTLWRRLQKLARLAGVEEG